jgi:hypothetical protein
MKKIIFILLVFLPFFAFAQEVKVEEKKPAEQKLEEQKSEEKIAENAVVEEKKPLEIPKKTPRKIHKKIIPKQVFIPQQYLLQINLSQDQCEKIVGGECFRRDKMRDEPYYHETNLKIFRGKIFAQQFFQGSERLVDKMFLPVKDGTYQLETNNKNLIYFSSKKGVVSDLKIQKDELLKEREPESKCNIAETIYGFYQGNDPSQIVAKTVLFKDEYNFEGFKELTFFVEKSNQAEVMVVTKNLNQTPIAVKDIRLCKMPQISTPQVYFVKHVNDEECKENRHKDVSECQKYSICEDFLVIKNCDVLLLRDAMN